MECDRTSLGGVKPGSNAGFEPDFGRILTQIEHVLHVVEARLASVQPQGGTHRALGEGHATRSLVRDLQSLAFTGEQHRMIAHHISTANSGEADGFSLAGTGVTFATIDRHLLQVATQRTGNHLTHAQRRTRRSVDLVTMVSLDYFNVRVITENASSHIEQFQRQVDPDAEIGGENDGNVLARLGQQLLLRSIQPSGADHHGLARLTAEGQVFQHDFRQGEVDQHIELFSHRLYMAGQWHANPPKRGQLTGVDANQRAAGTYDGRRQAGQRRALLHRFDQDLAHAPCSAHHSYTSHADSLQIAEEPLHAFKPARGFRRVAVVVRQRTAELLEQFTLTTTQVDRGFDGNTAHQIA